MTTTPQPAPQPEITHDPATWPRSDRLWLVCCAIAMAEGANIEGSNPDRLNNPGDISDDFGIYGGEAHSGSNITCFPNKLAGWSQLRNKLYRAEIGRSKVYHPDMTWMQLAREWAGDWQNWLANTCATLHCKPTDTVRTVL